MKHIQDVLYFIDNLGSEGRIMAKFVRSNKKAIIKDSPLYFRNFELNQINSKHVKEFIAFIKNNNLTNDIETLRFFYSICYSGLSLHKFKQLKVKTQTQKKVNGIDHYPNLKKDLEALKNINFEDYKTSELIKSIGINYGKNQNYNIQSPYILNKLDDALIKVLKEVLASEMPQNPPKTIDYCKSFILPVYRYIQEKYPHHNQTQKCIIIMEFWRLFDLQASLNDDYFRRNIL